MKIITTEKLPIKIWTEDVENEALEQLKKVANLPFIFKHVAAMPDVHYGRGATIGSVIATKGAIIPAAYKNIDEVMENQSDLVEVIFTLNQLICVKGSD